MVAGPGPPTMLPRGLPPLLQLIPSMATADTNQSSVLFGVGQESATRWDGTIEAAGARILDVSAWKPIQNDPTTGPSWRLAIPSAALTRAQTDRSRYPVLGTGCPSLPRRSARPFSSTSAPGRATQRSVRRRLRTSLR